MRVDAICARNELDKFVIVGVCNNVVEAEALAAREKWGGGLGVQPPTLR